MEDKILTIKEAAEHLNCSYNTVFNHRHQWGFFKMKGSRVWRIHQKDLDLLKIRSNNNRRLVLSVNEEKLCRSENEVMSITLTSTPQAVKELDELLKRL